MTNQETHDAAVDKVAGLFGEVKPEVVEKTEVPAEVEPQEAEAKGQEITPAQPEEVEVEIEGEKYLVPRKISDRFIHHADYTRKTMDLAEMRRATAAEREAIVMEKAFDQSTGDERNQLAMLDAQISQYRRVDWQSLETDQLLKARAQLDQLKEARAEIDNSIKAKRAQFDQKVRSVAQEMMTAGEKYIAQRMPEFNDTSKKQLFAYGVGEGYTRDEMEKLSDPRLVISLWKASQWDALQASKPGIKNKAAQAAPTVRPGGTQTKPSRIQQLSKAVKDAKTRDGKTRAAEEYFSAKFGG